LQSCAKNTIESLVLKAILVFLVLKSNSCFVFLNFKLLKNLVCKFSYVFRETTAADALGSQASGYLFKFCSY